ncbi:MAG: hypothetical protein M1817_000399 [Caeruleum heppii]|nr:MAG: hypothetical protein M1817_000399 [Caeruleum heppii]
MVSARATLRSTRKHVDLAVAAAISSNATTNDTLSPTDSAAGVTEAAAPSGSYITIQVSGYSTEEYVTATDDAGRLAVAQSVYAKLEADAAMSSSESETWVTITGAGGTGGVELDITAATDPSALASASKSYIESISRQRAPACTSSFWAGDHPDLTVTRDGRLTFDGDALIHKGPNAMQYFCCGYCTLDVEEVSLFYWQTVEPKTDCLTMSATNTILYDPRVAAGAQQYIHQNVSSFMHGNRGFGSYERVRRADGSSPSFTIGDTSVGPDGFTSFPSIYVFLPRITARDMCGGLGPEHTSLTLSFDPGELSTVESQWRDDGGFTKPFDFADITCGGMGMADPKYQLAYSTAKSPVPFSPTLALPSKFLGIDPAYSACEYAMIGVFDPPKALKPASGLAPKTTSLEAGPQQTPPTPASPPPALALETQAAKLADPVVAGAAAMLGFGSQGDSAQRVKDPSLDPQAVAPSSASATTLDASAGPSEKVPQAAPESPSVPSVDSPEAIPASDSAPARPSDDPSAQPQPDPVPPPAGNSGPASATVADSPGAEAVDPKANRGSPSSSNPTDPDVSASRKGQQSTNAGAPVDAPTLKASEPVIKPDQAATSINSQGVKSGSGTRGVTQAAAPSITVPNNGADPNAPKTSSRRTGGKAGASVFTVADQIFTANAGSPTISVGGSTIVAGGAGITVSGTVISLASDGDLVVGSKTMALPTAGNSSSTEGADPAIFTGGQGRTAMLNLMTMTGTMMMYLVLMVAFS